MRRFLTIGLSVIAVFALASVSAGQLLKSKPEAPIRAQKLPEQAGSSPVINSTLEDYQQMVQEALKPALLPLATERIRTERGTDVSVTLDKILVGPNGQILVRVETAKGGAFTQYSLLYKWQNGWQLVEISEDV
jgi:hypothetical protein